MTERPADSSISSLDECSINLSGIPKRIDLISIDSIEQNSCTALPAPPAIDPSSKDTK